MCNFSSRGSNDLSWSPQAPDTHEGHRLTCRQNTHIHRIIINSGNFKILNQEGRQTRLIFFFGEKASYTFIEGDRCWSSEQRTKVNILLDGLVQRWIPCSRWRPSSRLLTSQGSSGELRNKKQKPRNLQYQTWKLFTGLSMNWTKLKGRAGSHVDHWYTVKTEDWGDGPVAKVLAMNAYTNLQVQSPIPM